MKRLASLTTRVDGSELMTMDKLYPGHAKALQTAKLAPNTFPTLCEILDNQNPKSILQFREHLKEKQTEK